MLSTHTDVSVGAWIKALGQPWDVWVCPLLRTLGHVFWEPACVLLAASLMSPHVQIPS
jgi:hypothetical protein